ncbi:MAG: amidohydrolase family protein [Steroidobacteraceae bacterium]
MPESTDLSIEARWILPMDAPEVLLEDHAILVRGGRILEVLPQEKALQQHPRARRVMRHQHLIMPGLVNGQTLASQALLRGRLASDPRAAALRTAGRRADEERFMHDGALLAIATMLRNGVTCFADTSLFPEVGARAVAEHGLRAVIGLPVRDEASAWASDAGECLGKALSVRDEFKGHPRITCAFALPEAASLSEQTVRRVRTLADELDLLVIMPLHASQDEVSRCIARHGERPLQRAERLGLLTPQLDAQHMNSLTPEDLELARRGGIGITLFPEGAWSRLGTPPPLQDWLSTGLCVGLGTDVPSMATSPDPWLQLRLACLGSRRAADLTAWDALCLLTRGAAGALGIGDQCGTLEPGKWADLCCIDLDHPALQPLSDPLAQLLQGGSGDRVSDVWVAGQALLEQGRFTRLDWAALRARAQDWLLRQGAD